MAKVGERSPDPVLPVDEEPARRRTTRETLEGAGNYSMVGRRFVDGLSPTENDPVGPFVARTARDDYQSDSTWDETYFLVELGDKNNYLSLMLANWACFAVLPAWMREASKYRLDDAAKDLKGRRLVPGTAFEAALDADYFDRCVKPSRELLVCADGFNIGPFKSLRLFDRNPKLLKKFDRAASLAEDQYQWATSGVVEWSRDVDGRTPDRSEFAWANVAAAAEAAADRALITAGMAACGEAVILGRDEAGKRSAGWATLALKALSLSTAFARALAIKEACRVATREELQFFTPPAGDVSEWEASVMSDSTKVAKAVADRLDTPVRELRRHAFFLAAEMSLETGEMRNLFDREIRDKAKAWREGQERARESLLDGRGS